MAPQLSKHAAGSPGASDAANAAETKTEERGFDKNRCTCQASYLPHVHTEKGIEDVDPAVSWPHASSKQSEIPGVGQRVPGTKRSIT